MKIHKSSNHRPQVSNVSILIAVDNLSRILIESTDSLEIQVRIEERRFYLGTEVQVFDAAVAQWSKWRIAKTTTVRKYHSKKESPHEAKEMKEKHSSTVQCFPDLLRSFCLSLHE